MPLNLNKDLKMYYSIKEVSDMVGVPDSTLRYWEKQFKELNPKKSSSGVRQYTKDDIETIKLIHHLLKEKGLNIAAAKDRLKNTKSKVVESSEIVDRLKAVRDELQAMLDEMN